MSQPNRLIHSSGLLSFIRCNTDHERAPVSPVIPPLLFLRLSYKTCSHSSSADKREHFTQKLWVRPKMQNTSINVACLTAMQMGFIYSSSQTVKSSVKAALYSLQEWRKCRETDIWVIWEKTSQEFDIHLSQYHSLHPLSTLSFTDKALMLPLPSARILVARHRRKSKSKKKKSCQLATLSLHLSSLYQLVQVIITLTAFSVFTLSLNLSSRGACCANQLHRAPVTSVCSALLASTQGLTGACRRAAAPALSAKTAIFHRAVSSVTGSLSQAPHTSFSLCLLSASGWTFHKTRGRADMTSEPQCHAQGISAADDTVTSPAIGCMSSVMTRQKGFVRMV